MQRCLVDVYTYFYNCNGRDEQVPRTPSPCPPVRTRRNPRSCLRLCTISAAGLYTRTHLRCSRVIHHTVHVHIPRSRFVNVPLYIHINICSFRLPVSNKTAVIVRTPAFQRFQIESAPLSHCATTHPQTWRLRRTHSVAAIALRRVLFSRPMTILCLLFTSYVSI
jgi:hypothetical protein